jgi:hypothetical protein
MSWVAINKSRQEDLADIAFSRDQLILRIGGMSIVSEESGEQAFLRVRRKFSLTGPQSPSVNRQEGREQPISLIGNGTEVDHEPQPPQSKMAPSSSDSDPLPGLIRFAEWAEDAIASQRKDIGRISTVVSKIEKDMRSFKDFMIETRRDLATVPGGKPWASMKRSVTLLEEEMGSIRMELEARPNRVCDDDSVKLSVEELDVLTSSITKISQKVNEVESLKMELQFMKTRLKRFEEGSRIVKQAVETPAKENPPTSAPNPNSNTTRLPRSVRRIVGPRAQESVPEPPPNPNSNTRRVQGIVRGASADWDYTRTPMSETRTGKRKSDEFESDSALETMAASAINSQKKGKPLDPPPADLHHNPYWKVNHKPKPKPSRLSNVQHVDEIPDPLNPDLPFYPDKFTDGNYSEGERRPSGRFTKEREYDSAPESRPARRNTQPARQNSRRDSSTPEETSPPRKVSRLQALQRTKTSPRRRAYSEGLRNADGVRLTKNGTPDRRTGNYKYLKQYYEKLRVQKESETGPGAEQEQGGGGGGSDVMPSIKALTAAAKMREEDIERQEAIKQAELEARDRLVRETLEREL